MADSSVCTCGSMLPLPDLAGLMTCPSCGRVTRASSAAWPAPPLAAPDPATQWEPPAPLVGGSDPAPVPAPRPAKKRRGSAAATSAGRAGCGLATLVTFAAFAVGSVAIFRSCSVNEATDRLQSAFDAESNIYPLSGTGTVVSSDAERTDLIMTTQLTEDSRLIRRLSKVRFTPDGSEEVWASEALDESAYQAEVAVLAGSGEGGAGPIVFAAVDDQLLALDDATGTTKWRATLHDKVTTDCEDCFAVVDGTLIVRTTDAYVTAYGAESAESLWAKRLNSPAGSISVAKDRLFIVDEPEADEQLTAVQLVSPITGKLVKSVSPTCPQNEETPWPLEMSAGDPVWAVGDTDDVVAVFGFGDVCVTRWNPESGTVKWTSRLIGASSVSRDNVLVGPRDLVAGTSSSSVVTVNLTTGVGKVLDGPADAAIELDTISGRTLLAATSTTRGTARRGLAAWNLETGQRLWAVHLEGDPAPASQHAWASDALFDDSPRYVLVPVGDGMNLFVFEGEERTFTAAPLDLTDGSLGTEVRRGFLTRYDSGTPSLSVEGVEEERLVVSVDSVVQAIPSSGRGEVVGFP